MDAAIQAILTISLFAAVHERAIELARATAERFPFARRIVDWLTIGPGAVIPAVGMAVGTHANLLALFEFDDGKMTSKYFELYLSYGERFLAPRDLTGCVLMGLAAALGSKFWHDLAYGLVDLRQKARAATNQAVATTASLVPPAPSVAAPAPAAVLQPP